MTPRRRSSGLSLAELILALLLTLIAVLGLVGVVSYSLRAQAKSSTSHIASVIASNLMEDAQGTCWDNFSAPLTAARQVVPSHPGYEFAIAENLENADLKRVEISIYWNDREGARQFDLWTKLVRE
jgi:hypothetical protein